MVSPVVLMLDPRLGGWAGTGKRVPAHRIRYQESDAGAYSMAAMPSSQAVCRSAACCSAVLSPASIAWKPLVHHVIEGGWRQHVDVVAELRTTLLTRGLQGVEHLPLERGELERARVELHGNEKPRPADPFLDRLL